MEAASVPVEFTLEELWFLHDFVRHDEDAISEEAWPIVSTALNDDLALALAACECDGLKSYTLLLSRGDMLLLDWHVRRDMKTPEGARGRDVLVKLFKARRDLALGPTADGQADVSYEAALSATAGKPTTGKATRTVGGKPVSEEVTEDAEAEAGAD